MLSRYIVSQAKHNSYFIIGMVLGLWVALTLIPLDEEPMPCEPNLVSVAPTSDEFEPQREEKLLGPAGQTAGRSVQRPRYYSTELGMRGSLLTGVLSSEDALKHQVAALNRTAARLQPALKFFITASAMSSVPGLANVVGFTDTREMLKPFHALKYLADNFLEEYDFFFLVSDKAFVNARRLTELVSQLSISQDVYMGMIAEHESQYCSLDSGIILSNSVLRAVHNELDWCVRNSYSPHHHENIGRCVLHSAHLACTSVLQAESYKSLHMEGEVVSSVLSPELADAVTVHPLSLPKHFHQLHAYVSRVYLERDHEEVLRLRGYLWRNSARHPEGYRNSTWPGGLRGDPGMASPLPDNRFDHLRWTTFNDTHEFMPDDHHMIGPITGANREAIDLVMSTVSTWALRRWPQAARVQLLEGAWGWEPARALRYRLLLRLQPPALAAQPAQLRQVEVVRPLGAARLVPVRYVTESGRLWLVLPLPAHAQGDARDVFLRSYDAVCLGQDKNTNLIVVLMHPSTENSTSAVEVRENIASLLARHNGSKIDILDVVLDVSPVETEEEVLHKAAKVAVAAALDKLQRDSLVLVAEPHMEFNQDFLNRVRMNTIAGSQWYLPMPFARHSQYDHPRFVTASGAKPQQHTGRFNRYHTAVLAFYRADYDSALAEFRGPSDASIATILARAPLRAIRAPEPGLVGAPRPMACAAGERPACLAALSRDHFRALDLGAKHSLAMLLLEMQAELD